MNHAHRAVGRVDALAAGASGSERVDAQVFGVDVKVQLQANRMTVSWSAKKQGAAGTERRYLFRLR